MVPSSETKAVGWNIQCHAEDTLEGAAATASTGNQDAYRDSVQALGGHYSELMAPSSRMHYHRCSTVYVRAREMCVCVCSQVCMCVQLYKHACAHRCGGQRTISGVTPQVIPTLFFETGSLSWAWNSQVVRLVGKQVPGTHLSPPPQHWAYNCVPTPRLFTWVLRI